jgi:hypothetical protein
MNKNVQIQLINPCIQNWEDMQEVPGGKFCSSCEKKVIDFSLLNDRQIIEILRSTNSGCGRFADEQLDRKLVVTAAQSNSFIPAVLVSTALATGLTAAATPVQKQEITVTDSVAPYPTCDTIPGYYALHGDLEVIAYGTVARTIRLGGYNTATVTKLVNNTHRRRLSLLRRILIALRLSKRPI